MQTRAVALALALAFFSFVLASPVMVAESSELLARNASGPIAGLQLCLQICLDLQVKIKAILVVIAKLPRGSDISSYCNQIIVLIQACIVAIVKLGVVVKVGVKLSVADTACIKQIATVCAQIIIDIQTTISACSPLVLANVVAVLNLASVLVSLCVQLSVCIVGFVTVLAQICISLKLKYTGGLCLTAVLRLLGIAGPLISL